MPANLGLVPMASGGEDMGIGWDGRDERYAEDES